MVATFLCNAAAGVVSRPYEMAQNFVLNAAGIKLATTSTATLFWAAIGPSERVEVKREVLLLHTRHSSSHGSPARLFSNPSHLRLLFKQTPPDHSPPPPHRRCTRSTTAGSPPHPSLTTPPTWPLRYVRSFPAAQAD